MDHVIELGADINDLNYSVSPVAASLTVSLTAASSSSSSFLYHRCGTASLYLSFLQEVTPLHFAVARDNPRAMLRLLLAGASPYREDGMVRDQLGEWPSDRKLSSTSVQSCNCPQGMDALSTAVKSQSYRCLPFLLKCGPALLRAASTTVKPLVLVPYCTLVFTLLSLFCAAP